MKAKTFEEYLETINKFNIESEIRNSIRRKLKKITHMGYTFETSDADVGIDIGRNDDSFDIQKFIEIPEIRNILFEEYEYHKKIKLEKEVEIISIGNDIIKQFNLNYLTNEDINKIIEIISKYKDK